MSQHSDSADPVPARGRARRPLLFALVASHRKTDLEFLARLSSGPSRITSAEVAGGPAVSGAVILSTCNRFEIYCEVPAGLDADAARHAVLAVVSACSGIRFADIASAFACYTGPSVAEHLFAVAAGLDSAVVGEREIAGQIRRALTAAQASGAACGGLIRLFQAASRTAKDVGARTALGEAGRSIVSVALELAAGKSRRAGLSEMSAVVFGTGAYAGSTLALLRARHCPNISIYSSSGRAEAFAATRGATALKPAELPAAIRQADVVIGCSGRGQRNSASFLRQFRQGATGPLVVVDLALGRDFDPDIALLPNVEVITLETVRLAAPQAHLETLRDAAALVQQAARRFEEAQNTRLMDPAIVALRWHAQEVLNAEVDRVRAQHGPTATSEAVEAALRRMLRQLLHLPTSRARELAAAGRHDDYSEALEVLFGLDISLIGRHHAVTQKASPTGRWPVPHDLTDRQSPTA